MKWLKNKTDSNQSGYWDTISDVMSSLLLALLLVVMLMILYVVRAPDYNSEENIPESEIEDEGSVEQYIEREAGNAVVKTDVPYLFSDNIDEEYGSGELTGDYLYEDGGFEEGEFDGHEGAAVRVVVEDDETHLPIPEADVTFSLYTSEGHGIRLYSYYPSRTGWTRFVTDGSGTFYLPQKLVLSSYILHELTTPVGYEASEDIAFTLEEPSSWNEPYTLHVPLHSVRSTIHITAVDSVSNTPVPGSVFDILAAEDIKTKDGTVRFAQGSVVDQITCDEDGEGRSASLYLGSYTIQQSAAPEYYAVGSEQYAVTLGAGEVADAPVDQLILCDKTRYIVNVVDELYPSIGVADAEFILQDDQGSTPVSLMTDEQGSIQLDALNKSTAYTLTQSSTLEGYQVSNDELAFYVDENGRISGKSSCEEQVTNRTLRLSTLVQDALFKNPVSGCRVELYNEQNQLIQTWQTTDVEKTVQGIPAGQYRLQISGSGAATETLQMEDTAQIQYLNCSVWTMGNKLVIGGSAAGIIGIGSVAGILLSKRKQKKKASR